MIFPNELRPFLEPFEIDKEGYERAKHFCEARRFFAWIDAIDLQIASANDKPTRRKLQQSRSKIAQEFARHIDQGMRKLPGAIAAEFEHDRRRASIVLRVVGTPSRIGREEAAAWMHSRSRVWDGNIRQLRVEVRVALRNGETLPPGHFGLRVERTVEIGPISAIHDAVLYNEGRAKDRPAILWEYPAMYEAYCKTHGLKMKTFPKELTEKLKRP